MTIETGREADGRWIAALPKLPGVMVYGVTEAEARAKVTALAWRVLADRIEAGERVRLSPGNVQEQRAASDDRTQSLTR